MTKTGIESERGQVVPRRRYVDVELPPLPEREKRNVQVKIRLTPTEVEALAALRPDLSAPAVVAHLVDDALQGRYRPAWAAKGRSRRR